jgi:hypothetical protein
MVHVASHHWQQRCLKNKSTNSRNKMPPAMSKAWIHKDVITMQSPGLIKICKEVHRLRLRFSWGEEIKIKLHRFCDPRESLFLISFPPTYSCKLKLNCRTIFINSCTNLIQKSIRDHNCVLETKTQTGFGQRGSGRAILLAFRTGFKHSQIGRGLMFWTLSARSGLSEKVTF